MVCPQYGAAVLKGSMCCFGQDLIEIEPVFFRKYYVPGTTSAPLPFVVVEKTSNEKRSHHSANSTLFFTVYVEPSHRPRRSSEELFCRCYDNIYVDARTRTQNSRLISGDVPDLYRYLASRNAGLLLAFQNPVSNNKRTINSNVSLAHFVIELIGVCYVL